MFEPINTRVYRFVPKGLDQVTVYVEEYKPGSSRIIVQCFARAWTAYWGSHGSKPVEEFILSCSPEYVADGLTWGTNGLIKRKQEAHDYAYLLKIVTAMCQHFIERSTPTKAEQQAENI